MLRCCCQPSPTIQSVDAKYDKDHWAIKLNEVFGFTLYKINPKRTIEWVSLDMGMLKSAYDAKITDQSDNMTIATNMCIYTFKVVYSKHILDHDHQKIVMGSIYDGEKHIGNIHAIVAPSVMFNVDSIKRI